MKNITLIALDNADHLVHPEEFSELKLDSPALAIFTDFKKHKPLEIDADTPAVQTQYLMRKAHVRLKLVVDENEELIGTISLSELDEQRFLIFQNKGFDRKQIMVRELMLPRADIKAVDFNQLKDSSIADVIETLKINKTQHCLVVDQEMHQIRGIISASDIARRLHMPLKIENDISFVDIFLAVNA